MKLFVLVRYRLSISIVLVAFAATGAVFVFARPEYRPPSGGRQVSLAKFGAPAEGWKWADGQPGFRFGDREADWNISLLRPSVRPSRVSQHLPASSTGSSSRRCCPTPALR